MYKQIRKIKIINYKIRKLHLKKIASKIYIKN